MSPQTGRDHERRWLHLEADGSTTVDSSYVVRTSLLCLARLSNVVSVLNSSEQSSVVLSKIATIPKVISFIFLRLQGPWLLIKVPPWITRPKLLLSRFHAQIADARGGNICRKFLEESKKSFCFKESLVIIT